MIFLLNFVHFEAIFAYSETIFADSEADFADFETKIPDRCGRGSSLYRPIHDVAPRAVSTADAIDTINCVINLIVSLFVITHLLSLL